MRDPADRILELTRQAGRPDNIFKPRVGKYGKHSIDVLNSNEFKRRDESSSVPGLV